MLDLTCLVCSTLILGFAAFSAGGVAEPQWGVCLITVSALSLLVWLPAERVRLAPALSPALSAILILLPSYAALQMLPLPLAWLSVISPARAELQHAAVFIGADAVRAPLSAAPSVTLAHVLRLLCYICCFCIGRELTWRLSGRLWLTALPVVLCGSAEAVLGLSQYFGGTAFATGTYVNPNHYSCFLQMTLPFPLALAAIAMHGRRRGAEGSPGPVLLTCVLLGCAVLIFLGALYSMSRMGLAATVISLLVLLLFWGMWKSVRWPVRAAAALAGGALVLFVFVSTPYALLQRLAGSGPGDLLTPDVRLKIWQQTIRMTADYRLFGSGLGSYASVFQKYSTASPLLLVDFAHNDYLQLLAELGMAGFAIALAAALIILWPIFRAVRTGRTTDSRLLAAASAAALVALMLDSSVDFDFYIPANALLAAWIAGIGTAAGQDLRIKDGRDRRASS